MVFKSITPAEIKKAEQKMNRITISSEISYYPPFESPLSANVVLIEGKEFMWIYDVGNNSEIVKELNEIGKAKKIILSHFHTDHIANLESIKYDELFQGRFTYNHTKTGNIIEQSQTFFDGDLKMTLMPFPSSHAKGSLAVEVNDKFLFTGDGTYSTTKNGRRCYNTGLLLEQIRLLRATQAEYILQSHQDDFCVKKDSVIELLSEIYEQRTNGNPYIYI